MSGERLRQSFKALDPSEVAAGTCPPPEKIWDAQRGELPRADAELVVDHIAECPSCASDWRLAMSQETPQPVTTTPWRTVLALAATLILAAGLVLVHRSLDTAPEGPPVYRSGQETIRAMVEDGATLPRSEALLRWSPVGDDTLYSVEVGLPDLTHLVTVYDLRETSYTIPAEEIADLPPDQTIVWQVEAKLVDGRTVRSRAFTVKLE
jgi:hypothetical protein